MSEEMTMVRMCAPTLAGMKTGSLYNFHYDDRTEMMKAVQNWNRKLRDKGICMIPLRYADHTALIYLFRPEQHLQALRLRAERGGVVEDCVRK